VAKVTFNETQLIKRRERSAVRVMSDYQCQLDAIETMKSTRGDDSKDPCLLSEHGIVQGKSNGHFQSKSKAGVLKAIFTIIPYFLYAYDVSRSSFKKRKKDLKEGTITQPESEKPTYNRRGTSVINDSAMCKERYSARFVCPRKIVVRRRP
jgi:hypothetical protein